MSALQLILNMLILLSVKCNSVKTRGGWPSGAAAPRLWNLPPTCEHCLFSSFFLFSNFCPLSISHFVQANVCVCALGELQGCFWPCSKEEESGWTLFAIIGQQRPSLLYFKRLLSHLSYKRTAVLRPFTRLSSVFNTHLFKEKIPDHSWSLPEEHLTKWVCLPLQFGLYFVWKASNADKKCIMLLGLLWRKQ